MYLRRVRVVGRSFAAALANVSRVATPPAHAAQKPRRRPSVALPGQTCGGMLRAIARNSAHCPCADHHAALNEHIDAVRVIRFYKNAHTSLTAFVYA
jgi:hypothetical protein